MNHTNQNYGLQICRIDGKNCFLEMKTDAFDIGKMLLGFYTYDATKAKGSRQTHAIKIYLDFAEFLALENDISINVMLKKAQIKKNSTEKSEQYAPLFEKLGGTSIKSLSFQGNSRKDGKPISRVFKISMGLKFDFLFQAESGPGKMVGSNGLIAPDFGKEPENKISLPVNNDVLKGAFSLAKMYLNAYITKKMMNPDAVQQEQQGEPEYLNQVDGDCEDEYPSYYPVDAPTQAQIAPAATKPAYALAF